MSKYVIKRILFLIPTVIGVTLIIYFVMNLTPGNPARAILGTGVPQADIDAYNHAIGYDLPFLQRYIVTMKLAFTGMIVSTIIGIPLGICAAVKQYSVTDTVSSLISFLLAAVPTFVLGLVLLFVFSLKLGWLPSYGITDWTGYIMPVLAISIPIAAQNFRFTKSSMLDAIHQDYVRTARAKGATEKVVIWKHVLKNALLPVITQIGMNLGLLLCGAVVAEQLFSVQGIGSLIVSRITLKDEPVIIAGTILISICFTIVMLMVDIIYAFIDPRIRAKYTKKRG